MKPLIVLAAALALLLAGCHHRTHHHTNISVSENSNIYQLSASFNPSKTRTLQHYLDNHLGETSNFSFVNATMDATVTLDDETRFYIKSYPGFVKIKFNKHENSYEAYEKMKNTCEGIKRAIH